MTGQIPEPSGCVTVAGDGNAFLITVRRNV